MCSFNSLLVYMGFLISWTYIAEISTLFLTVYRSIKLKSMYIDVGWWCSLGQSVFLDHIMPKYTVLLTFCSTFLMNFMNFDVVPQQKVTIYGYAWEWAFTYRFLKRCWASIYQGPHRHFQFLDKKNSLPNIWKTAKMVPILKPNKTPAEPPSYRLISLLCNHFKMFQRLVLTDITPHIPLPPTQRGFRARHSATILLTAKLQHINEGLNAPNLLYRTMLATLVISKAFNAVPRARLLENIYNTNMDTRYKRWLGNYLTGRRALTMNVIHSKTLLERSPTRVSPHFYPFQSIHAQHSISHQPKRAHSLLHRRQHIILTTSQT